MAAYAALVSLMNNIEQIQRHTRLPIHFDQKQSEFLLEKVNLLIDFLENYDYRGAGEEIKDLENQITDAAYAAEDIIETHVVDAIDAHSRSNKGENDLSTDQSTKNPSCLPSIEKVMEAMDFMKEEVMKMKAKRALEEMQSTSAITPPSSTSNPAGTNIMVGFDDQLLDLMERLAEDQSSRKIIPIVGMGGIGKTTLAKTAYDKPFNTERFDFRAWVSISQEYDFKRIVLGLLPNESSQMSSTDLAQRLHKRLCGRRYLVVLDDMWSVDAWNMVKQFLPDDKNGSRIIVTTRNSNVATHLDTCSLKMKFLGEDESWNLFCKKVFVQESCPLELEEVGRKIVENCKGLPLSIVVIGGLLAKSKWRKNYWEDIAQDTTEIISLEEQCTKILSLSYQNLPVHLKPCFLYTGAFPKGKSICVSVLIKLWVAEGFLKSNCSKQIEVLGKEYLNDLISRNLIMADKRGPSGKIKYFMIHDLLRDMCLKKAENEKFMYVRKWCNHHELQFIGNPRRISFHSSGTNKEKLPQVPATLVSGSKARTLICDDIYKVLPLQNLRLLRVSNYITTIRSDEAGYSLNDTCQLVNSRLIRVCITSPTTFPSSLCLLWNLKILIVETDKSSIAPLEIWEMTELRHLEFDQEIYLPNPPPSQQMKTRGGNAIMKNLQALKGIRDFRFSVKMVKRIPNITKLKISYVLTGKEMERGLKYLSLLLNLKSLYLTFKNQTSSDLLSNLAFPNSLKKLILHGCALQWEDMSMIALLPHLEVLKLYNAFRGSEWVLVEEGFPCLKFLMIAFCNDLVHWEADETHFPCLVNLELVYLDKLEEIPSGIGDIPTLQKIELYHCSKSAVVSAKKILEEQEELGNVGLRVEASSI